MVGVLVGVGIAQQIVARPTEWLFSDNADGTVTLTQIGVQPEAQTYADNADGTVTRLT